MGVSAADDSFDRRGGTAPSFVPGIRWRQRLLALASLVACATVFLLAHALASHPVLPGQWRADQLGYLDLGGGETQGLARHVGHAVIGLQAASGEIIRPDAHVLLGPSRWTPDATQRAAQAELRARIDAAAAAGPVRLIFDDGSSATVTAAPRGWRGLGPWFWVLAVLAVVPFLIGFVVLAVKSHVRNVLYAVMTTAQSIGLLCIGVELVTTLGSPLPGYAHLGSLRMALDLVTAGAIFHAASVHPRTLPAAPAWIVAGWAAALAPVVAGVLGGGHLAEPWWWSHGTVVALGIGAVGLFVGSYRLERHPASLMLARFGAGAAGAVLVLTLTLAGLDLSAADGFHVATIGSVVCAVLMAVVLVMVPFLARRQYVLREFAMLAGVGAGAACMDMAFVALFSISPFASLTLSLILAVALYAGLRQWLLSHVAARRLRTTGRLFEQLYIIAREVEREPQRAGPLLSRLLQQTFEPLEAYRTDRPVPASRVSGDGAMLLVPEPALVDGHVGGTLVMRYAERGKRLFNGDDARLTDQLVEQLRRALAFDRAVEQGRAEERARIAQDLHDDIGARLLTLMYKAPSQEMEDYIRHTLQDLKTLTRGLAASRQRLGEAAAEWKRDIGQRLNAAGCELDWHVALDEDPVLSAVEWSALTRILRELVNNILVHSGATRVEVDLRLHERVLTLQVADDGGGRAPEAWSHGLGLGGIRKRVKLLGGQARWEERPQGGIVCRISLPAPASDA
jgi:signal transduction histidine kinase